MWSETFLCAVYNLNRFMFEDKTSMKLVHESSMNLVILFSIRSKYYLAYELSRFSDFKKNNTKSSIL